MGISKADVEKIAELARLELTAEEAGSFTDQLSSILGHIDKLNELESIDAAPMSHCSTVDTDTEYTLRDDLTRPSLGQDVAIDNAPDAEAGYFKVPRVIGG